MTKITIVICGAIGSATIISVVAIKSGYLVKAKKVDKTYEF